MPIISYSQAQRLQEYSNDAALPQWAKMMYSINPNIGDVVTARNLYYKTHPFKKMGYTQYYKHWLQRISRDYKGTALGQPVSAAMQLNLQQYLQRSNAHKNAKSATSNWRCIGPFDFDKESASASYAAGAAHVYAVEQSISNPNILYAGSANAGLWKSINKGLNWTGCTFNQLIAEVYALEIDFSNSNVVYFGDGSQIYKTTDGGLTFQLTGNAAFQAGTHYTRDIIMNPQNNHALIAACDDGLWRSDDAGQNWNQLQTGAWQRVLLKPGDTTVWYAVLQTGSVTQFFKSTDGGKTFSIRPNGWPLPTGSDENKRTQIAVTPAAPNIVYAYATGAANGGSGLYGIYVSHNAGESWIFNCCGAGPGGAPNAATNINICAWAQDGSDDGGQYYYDLALAVSPIDSNEVHCGAVNHWVSHDGGFNFTCPSNWSQSQNVDYVHADIHDMNFYGNDFWLACDGGVFYSKDYGDTISRKMFGIAGSDFWGFGMGYWNGTDVFIGGAYHNGTFIKDNNVYNNGWVSAMGGDNILGNVNYGNERQIFCDYGKFQLSGNRSISFIQLPSGMLPSSSYIVGENAQMKYDPACYNAIYMGNDSTLWHSTDGGANFNAVHQFNDGTVAAIEIAANRTTIYATTFSSWWNQKSVYKSIDTGNTWINITPSNALLGGSGNNWAPYEIAVGDSANDLWLVRTMESSTYPNLDGYKVYKTRDGGNTWINLTTATLDGEYPTNIVYQKGSNGGVYIGTRRAVYYRNNTMNDWQLFNDSLPAVTFSTQLIINYKNQKIYQGTNRSVYQCDLYESNFAPVAQISVDKTVSGCLRDTFYFVDHSALSANSASWSWSFPNGNPSSSTLRSPKVVYTAAGKYSVSLTVTDANGTNSQTLQNFITISDNCSADTIPGKALQLNGVDASAAINPLKLNSNNVTFSAWIKPNAAQNDYTGIIFSRGDTTAEGLTVMQSLELRYHWNNQQWWWSSGLFLTPNQWNHIALVVTPSAATLYLNGIAAVNNVPCVVAGFNSPLMIGVDGSNGTSRNFNGIIDEVCIYNRSLSQNEIREQMHLTRKPTADPALVAYYQFNESSGEVLDKAGLNHASLASTCVRVPSTAPLGGGVSSRLTVNSSGNILFGNTGCDINFATNNPNGEVVLSRINLHPNLLPNTNNASRSYFILDNYGSNNSFTSPTTIDFHKTGNIAAADASSPNLFHLFRRNWNDDGNNWSEIDSATQVISGSDGDVNYTNNVACNQSSQLVISSRSSGSYTGENQITASSTNEIKLYPSPVQSGATVFLKSTLNEKMDAIIYNADGKKITQFSFQNFGSLNTSGFAAGNYFYQIKSSSRIQNGIFVVVK